MTVLETSLDYGAPSYQQLGGELISINVRLLVTLRQQNVEGAAARRFLARFERGIADDRLGLAHALNPVALERWTTQSQEGNATLANLAKRIGAPHCAEYFGTRRARAYAAEEDEAAGERVGLALPQGDTVDTALPHFAGHAAEAA